MLVSPVSLSSRTRSSARAQPVPDFQVGKAPANRVGGEHRDAPAVGVGDVQLGAGVWTSRRAMMRIPGGQPVKLLGIHRVNSATWAPSRRRPWDSVRPAMPAWAPLSARPVWVGGRSCPPTRPTPGCEPATTRAERPSRRHRAPALAPARVRGVDQCGVEHRDLVGGDVGLGVTRTQHPTCGSAVPPAP
jgi:hypothetical protein